jgi:zinc transporter 7
MESSASKAFAATFFISVIPNIFLFLVPTRLLLQSSKTGSNLDLSSLFLSFACGGLLGDVFIHIIPHLLGAHVHGSGSGKLISSYIIIRKLIS